jgi:type II secretory pathway predicted ATPase ExeA/cell division septation protein DedD
MYSKFFGFKEKPFKLAPNPEYLFMGKSHEKALTHLLFAISQGKKSLRITGELGTGKTTLCRAFFGNLDESIAAAYISAHKMDAVHLLKAINDAFFIDTSPDNTKDLIDIIYGFLIKKRTAGQKALVLIDEAQNLSHEALEQILLLSNLETAEGKLLMIILVGQPELNDMLSSDQLRELGQRLTKNCQLAPLTFLETIDYIEHRLSHAAHKEGPPFDKASCRVIYEYSGGIPKLINIGCEMALMNAFNRNSSKITGTITRDAIKVLTQEKQGKPDEPDKRHDKAIGLAILSAFLVSLVIILLYSSKGQLPETTVIDESVNKTKILTDSGPIAPAMDKLKIPEKPLVINQHETSEKIAAGGTMVSAGPGPTDPVMDKPETSEKPLAIHQSETDEKIAEYGDIYSVHVGTFKTASQANMLLNKLKSLGFPSFGYTSSSKNGNTVHVVVAGKYQSYDLAKEASRSLSKKGHSNFITKAKDSLKIPAGSAPISHAEDKLDIPEKPLAVSQSETSEKIAEDKDVYAVHTGTFKTASEANQLLNNLQSLGYPSFGYTSLSKKGNTVYVVVAGKYQSYDLAKQASRSLSKKGHSNFIAKAKDSLKEGPAK